MPYFVQHKCSVTDDEWQNYATIRPPNDNDAAMLVCEKCGERLFIIEQDAYARARAAMESELLGQPGMVFGGRKV